MAFIRKKTIEMDGVSVTIAPLLSGQADEFLTKQKEILNGSGEAKESALRDLWLDFIAIGLSQGMGPESKFTAKSVQEDFDKVFLERVRLEIMEMSGIGVVGEAKTP